MTAALAQTQIPTPLAEALPEFKAEMLQEKRIQDSAVSKLLEKGGGSRLKQPGEREQLSCLSTRCTMKVL